MKAMILAAGRGERMRPLTDSTPKPLLSVGGKPLIEYHILGLKQAGFSELVINIAYLGEQIRDYLGDGSRWGVSIDYSVEPEPLETAGAILNAMPLLGEEAPFLLVNGDIWTNYSFGELLGHHLGENTLAHLVLVDNPEHHPVGDFSINDSGLLVERTENALTYSGMAIINPVLVTQYPECRTKFPLGEVFRYGIAQKSITAEYFNGQWQDIGTKKRLEQLDHQLRMF